MSSGTDHLHQVVRDRFGYHRATDDTAGKHAAARALCIDLADNLIDIVDLEGETDGEVHRAVACALTSLQEALMWTNAAIALRAPLTNDE